MQDTGTTPLQSPGVLGALTTVHFVLIAVLAVITIIGILYGMKLARQRRQGTRELEESGHLERTGETPAADPDIPSDPDPTPGALVERPVAPSDARAPATIVETPAAIEFASEPAAAPPAQVPASAPGVGAPAESDLTRLKGLGPKVATMLVDQGIPDIAALARLDAAQADAVAARLGTFAPRMVRDRWVEQARLLAAGDIAGFEAIFGKL